MGFMEFMSLWSLWGLGCLWSFEGYGVFLGLFFLRHIWVPSPETFTPHPWNFVGLGFSRCGSGAEPKRGRGSFLELPKIPSREGTGSRQDFWERSEDKQRTLISLPALSHQDKFQKGKRED